MFLNKRQFTVAVGTVVRSSFLQINTTVEATLEL